MEKIKVKIEVVDKEIPLPKYQTSGSAGMDLHSAEELVVPKNEFRVISTGLKFAIPFGYEMHVRARSGLAAKLGITVLNGPGTIDSDYRGILKVILINHGKEDFKVNKGDRIAQIVFNKFEAADLEVVDSLEETSRGEGGFGSTGLKG